MNRDDIKYLRQLVTKDGLRGPIEEMLSHSLSEIRVIHNPMKADCCEVVPTASFDSRKYITKKSVPCLLFVMEEE